jgi:hypothetical protein
MIRAVALSDNRFDVRSLPWRRASQADDGMKMVIEGLFNAIYGFRGFCNIR